MMDILLTKLFYPALPPIPHVQRTHLIRCLNDGLRAGKSVTLISAPAGFGKTVFGSMWVEQLGEPVAWVSLDAQDNEPSRFFTYLVAALQQVDDNLGWEIEGGLRSGQVPSGEKITTTLVNDILHNERRLVLVLDDFQVIRNAFILGVFESLVMHLPPLLHLVIITREDPALPLARLRANNQLAEIRAADLRLNRQESAYFLNTTMGLSLTESAITVLEEKTEGWMVGLQLAALTLQQQDSAQRLADLSGSHRHILNYLTEEVLNQQTETTRRFLLQTAILNRLTGDLCDAITGREDSQAQLEQLTRANLFLFPLDHARQWYQYHQLFTDLLRPIQTTQHKDETVILHQRASHWYAKTGMIDEAIYHALAAEDRTLAVSLVETHAMDMLMGWHVKTVERWLHDLPAVWRSPKINMAAAQMYLFRGDFMQASAYIDLCNEQEIRHDPSLRAEWLALRATLLNAQGKTAEGLHLADQALALVSEENAYVRSLIYMGKAGAYHQMNDYPSAIDTYQRIIAHGRAAASLMSELLGISGLGLIALHHGQFYAAFEAASQGANRLEETGVLPPISSGIYGELGQIYYAWNQPEAMHYYFRRSVEVSALSGYSDAEIYYAVIRSRLSQRTGDLEMAVQEIQTAVALMQVNAPAAVREQVIAQQVRIALAQGQPAVAERLLAGDGFTFANGVSLPDLITVQDSAYPFGLLYNSALRIMLHRGQTRHESAILQQGIALAQQLVESMLQGGYLPIAVEALLLLAQMQAAMGDTQANRDDILRAVTLAEPENFISVFIDEGQPIAEALTACYTDADGSEMVNRIRAAFAKPEQKKHPAATIEALTDRERDVLCLMADGLKYQEIADRLFISLNTVRFYVKEIYSKWHVNNRTRALELARQQNLI